MTLIANDTERRILGHLPIWRDPQAQATAEAAEKDAGSRSITAYSTDELVARLSMDKTELSVEVQSQENPAAWVAAQLEGLAKKGFCESDGTGWKTTQAGAEALAQPNEGVPEPPAHDVDRIKGMVEFSTKLLAAGMEPGSDEFNKAGGITRQGVAAWRAAHAPSAEPAVLDAIEAQAPAAPEPSDLEAPNAA